VAFSQTKLAAMFTGPPTAIESEVIDFMAIKWLDFFSDSTVAGSGAIPSALSGADAAFRSSAVGLSVSGQGAQKMQDAMSAFWAAAMASAPSVWITVPTIVPGTGIVPPGLSGMVSSLSPVFASNTSGSVDTAAAAANLASAIIAAQSGATVTLGPPPPGGTPLVPVL